MKAFSFQIVSAAAVSLTAVLSSQAALAADFKQAVADYNGGRYAIANKELESCKQAYPSNPTVHYYLALCKQSLGQIETAKSEFNWVMQNGDARLKSYAQTGLSQLSKVKMGGSNVAIAAASTPVAPSQTFTAHATGKVKRIIEFYADWCNPCKEFAPTFEAVTSKLRGIQVERVNLDENQELAAKYSVKSIPRMIMLDGNNNAIYNDSPPRQEESLTELINSYR